MLEAHIFEKKRKFCGEKCIAACFFFVLSSVTNLKGRFVRVQQVFWQLLSKLFDHFCYTWEVVENTNFCKNWQTFLWKKLIDQLFSYYPVWQTSRNNLQGSTSYSYNYCGIYKRIFWEPRMLLKTQVFAKNDNNSNEKNIVAYFFSNYRVWQTSRDNLYGSKSCSDNYCGTYKSIVLGPKVLLKTQNFEK